MQPTVHEPDQSHKMKVDDEGINFRPSPNFKHMKKYLKSKFEEEHQNSLVGVQEKDASNQLCHITLRKSTDIQPPLPPNPPPPTTCMPMLIPKKEIEDDDLQSNSTEDSCDSFSSHESSNPPKENGIHETMCRNFVRGTCKRGATCKFVHKLIISQLPGVFTFCNNFQNSECTLPQCRFVHATVFEKENFYRTGFLPAHTLSHIKYMRPPQTLPNPNDDFVFAKPPPPKVRPGVPPVRVVIPSSKPEVFQTTPQLTTLPLKRPCSESVDFGSSPRDLESSEPLAKKCKSCDSNQFRYLYNKNKLEKMVRTSDEMNKKLALLNKKMVKLCTVISVLFKPMVGNKGINGIAGLNGDKDKALLEPFNFFLSANNRLSLMDDDSNKKRSFSNLLAKLLLDSSDPTKSPQRNSPSDVLLPPTARSSQR